MTNPVTLDHSREETCFSCPPRIFWESGTWSQLFLHPIFSFLKKQSQQQRVQVRIKSPVVLLLLGIQNSIDTLQLGINCVLSIQHNWGDSSQPSPWGGLESPKHACREISWWWRISHCGQHHSLSWGPKNGTKQSSGAEHQQSSLCFLTVDVVWPAPSSSPCSNFLTMVDSTWSHESRETLSPLSHFCQGIFSQK